MNIEYGKVNGVLRWVRNPFTGIVTYFNDIHRKTHSFQHLTSPQNASPTPRPALSPQAWQTEMQRVTQACVFCPGNEAMTPAEVMCLSYGDLYTSQELPTACQADAWAMRVFHNLIPRVPEECTGGHNESYIIVEDARHFLPEATALNHLMWSGALPAAHYYRVFQIAVDVVRRALANPAVESVLIRKHQGRESGASQPHIHMQVLGADRLFPDVEREMQVTARHPAIWQESVEFMRAFNFDLEAGDGIVSQWSPFGKFSRQFEVISLPDRRPIHAIPEPRLRLFVQYAYRLLRALGTAPHDLEIHHGEGIPLHAHLNARRFVYANIGGTLNAPVDVADHVIPPTRHLVRLFAQQMATAEPQDCALRN
ncbi:hypothetical protein NKDENANG_00576 [Candidatus Entotheonellaceae bacterium PAL068K]